MKTILQVSGMHCASCASSIESSLQTHEHVESATVNIASKKATIIHSGVSTNELISLVEKAGYAASEHVHNSQSTAPSFFPYSTMIAAGVLVTISMGPMIGIAIPENALTVLVQLVLTTGILYLNKDIFSQGVLSVLKTKSANMDTLVSLGVSAAYLYSLYIFVSGLFSTIQFHQLFFETAGVIIAFVSIGRYFEEKATRQTGDALRSLLKLTPETAIVISGKSQDVVEIDQIQVGDVLKVKPGERIPLDGVIHVGSTRIDESLVTGESDAVKKKKGDTVYGGSMNKTGMILVKVTAQATQSTVAKIAQLVQEAQESKAPIQRVADKIAARFVPLVLVLATLTFIGWMLFPPLGVTSPIVFASQAAIAVLVIACPCALGLATPTAVMAGMGRAGKQGIVFADAATLQQAANVKLVAFDKTGTLTVGKPVVRAIKTYNDLSAQVVFRYAASLASTSTHPLSEAIVSYAQKEKINFGTPRKSEEIEGRGLTGKVEGRSIVVGSLQFFVDQEIGLYDVRERVQDFAKKHYTPVLVAVEGKIAALIGISDALRDNAKEGVESLSELGIQTAMLTGDRKELAERIAKELSIGIVRAELSPKDKLQEINRMKKKRSVAMVGDGINDAPALAAADVGIVLSSSTAVAADASSIRIVSDEVVGVGAALKISKDTLRVVKQNLGWAFGYNIVAIPVAMGVLYPFTGWLLSPMIAGAAMAASSLSVVLNSLRLR